MAKKIRFSLEMDNGIEVRTLEELQEYFSLEKVLLYHSNGKLITWLKDRYMGDIAEELELIDADDGDINKKICKVFDIEYDEQSQIDIDLVAERNRRITLLKEYTSDEELIKSIDKVAFEQDDIYDLLDEEETIIYLCGDKFQIPISQKGVTYIGVNNPLAVIPSKTEVDFDEKGISLVNVTYDEKYQKIIEKNKEKEIVQQEETSKLMLSDDTMYEVKTFIDSMKEYLQEFLAEYEDYDWDVEFYDEYDLEFDPSDYYDYSNSYDYETKAKAKAACKEQLQEAIDDAKESHKYAKEEYMSGCEEFISEYEDVLQGMIDGFYDSYDEYINLECGPEAEEYLYEQKERLLSLELISGLKKKLNLQAKFEALVKETFDDPLDEIISIKKYWDMCTYDKDDGEYAFDLDDAVYQIHLDVQAIFYEASKRFSENVMELYASAKGELVGALNKKLNSIISKGEV